MTSFSLNNSMTSRPKGLRPALITEGSLLWGEASSFSQFQVREAMRAPQDTIFRAFSIFPSRQSRPSMVSIADITPFLSFSRISEAENACLSLPPDPFTSLRNMSWSAETLSKGVRSSSAISCIFVKSAKHWHVTSPLTSFSKLMCPVEVKRFSSVFSLNRSIVSEWRSIAFMA